MTFIALSSKRRVGLLEKNFQILLDNTQSAGLMRIGSNHDGGYLLPIGAGSRITAVFSPGTGDKVDLEAYFADQGIQVHLLDGSMDKPPFEHKNFEFERAWLVSKKSVYGEAETLEAAKNYDLESWVSSRQSDAANSSPNHLLLQMDIEGHEFGVISEVSQNTLEKFEVILVEFHWRHASLKIRDLTNVRTVFNKLCHNHSVVAISANNGDFAIPFWGGRRIPVFFEVTFLRRGSELFETKGEEKVELTLNDKRFRPLKGVDWLEYPER